MFIWQNQLLFCNPLFVKGDIIKVYKCKIYLKFIFYNKTDFTDDEIIPNTATDMIKNTSINNHYAVLIPK